MRSAKPMVAFLVFAATACGGHTGGAGPTAPPQPAKPAPSASSTPVPIKVYFQAANGQFGTITESVRGRKIYTIRALSTLAERFGTNEATGTLEQPHITFFDKSGTTTYADAPKATVAERDKSVVMMGGVHARTSKGSVLTCDQLRYNANTERLHGEGHVRLLAPNGLELGGQHLDGDVKLQDVRVTGSAG